MKYIIKPKIAFDIDYTLVGENYAPRHEVIDLFRWFERQGWDMIIWSGGGIEYAERWAEKLGLKARIIEKCSEVVDIAVDDEMDERDWSKDIKAKIVIKV